MATTIEQRTESAGLFDAHNIDEYGPDVWFDDGTDPVVGRWAASTDEIGGWIIRATTDDEFEWPSIWHFGTPVVDVATVRRLVPCTDAALNRYGATTGPPTGLHTPTNQEETE